ncbi:MAG: SpoIIE family protein phosphatase [Myxococcota bacterium]
MGTKTVGLLIDWLENDYQNQIVAAVEDSARNQGVNFVCVPGGALDSDKGFRFGRHRNFLYEVVSPKSVDGLVIAAGPLGNQVGIERLTDFCERFRPLPMCTISIPLHGIPCVTVDNQAGLRVAITSLIVQSSRRRIAFIRGPETNSEAEQRYAVYTSVLAEYGIVFDAHLVASGSFTYSTGVDATRTLIERNVPFDALVAANDYMALGALDELVRRGLRVPGDVAVVGFDDIAEARFAAVPLATVRQPVHRVGRCALEIVLKQLAGENVAARTILSTRFVARQSSGAVAPAVDVTSVVAGSSLAKTLQRRRGLLIERLAEHCEEGEDLATLFLHAMETLSPEALLEGVVRLARRWQQGGEDGRVWQTVLVLLEAEFKAYTRIHPELAEFGSEIWKELLLAVYEVSEHTQAAQLLAFQRHQLIMRAAGERLSSSLDTAQIMEVLARELSELGVISAHVALFGAERVNGSAELALRQEGGAWNVDTQRFPIDNLIPQRASYLSERRSLIVEPLHFQEEQLGYLVCEPGPLDGAVYEALREQVSGAVKRARLLRELLQQHTLRERAEREQLQSELVIACRIQTSILPRDISIEGLQIAASMLPATEIGGDYYDVVPRADGCWLGIGDVAGHGLQSGLVMLMIQSMISTLARLDAPPSPAEIICAVNRALYENVRGRLRQDEHATLCLFRYHRDGALTFAGGHEDALIYRAATNTVESLSNRGPWVGGVSELNNVEQGHQHLQPGDVLLLYTDGVIEAHNVSHEPFGSDRLIALLQREGREPVERIREHIFETILAWSPTVQDDITVLVARHVGPAQPSTAS